MVVDEIKVANQLMISGFTQCRHRGPWLWKRVAEEKVRMR